jgi:RNA polymerase sigma-70 factor (ECF subfamily)
MKGMRRGVSLPEIESLLREGVVAGLPDRDLLERFVSNRDRSGELAFTALVARHGRMVLGVCRRILCDPTEADDAFQATFLVLARKAGSIRLTGSLGPWLYGVSTRVARRIHNVATRRRPRTADEEWLRSIPDRRQTREEQLDRKWELNESLDSLPNSFRTALRLCYYEGLTHEEAAARLGCPVGTVRSRLARGRALLRRRLEGPPMARSLAISAGRHEAGLVTPVLAPCLIHSTARVAMRIATGQPLAGVVPDRIATLAIGVIGTMSRTKFIAAAVLLVSMISLAALGAWAGQSRFGDRERPAVPENGTVTDGAEFRPAIAFAQTANSTRRQTTSRTGKAVQQPVTNVPADFPAFVVATQPKLGDVDVDATTTKEIRIIFSKPMRDKSWSLTQGNVWSFPESAGEPHYLPDQRTCVIPVKLEPGMTYVMGINGGRFNNFKDADGTPSLPSSLAFRTRKAN